MNHKTLKTMMLFLIVAFSLPLGAQNKKFPTQEFLVRVGYGNLVKGTSALTSSTHSYERKLSQGVTWNAEYNFRPIRQLGIGLFYSGFSSQGSHAEGSDHLYIHYIAPQLTVYTVSTEKWDVALGVGVGKMYYRNNSYVFGKSRRATGDTWSPHANLFTTYKLNRHWGIGIGVQYLVGELNSINVRYHGETIQVKYSTEEEPDLTRLNISASLAYHF